MTVAILSATGGYKIERPQGTWRRWIDYPPLSEDGLRRMLDFAPPSVGKIGTEFGL